MASELDRTTGLHAIVGRPSGGSWYLLVALDDQSNGSARERLRGARSVHDPRPAPDRPVRFPDA